MYKTILVPLDGSKRAEAILPHAEEMARRFSAKIVFMQVVEYHTISELNIPEFAQHTEKAGFYLKMRSGEFSQKGIETKNLIELGPVVSTIINVAAREEADLIAMASHGRTGLSRVFYGSVAAGVFCNK
ncbi:MAG: universal stress protein [Chloroflexi bacterium]|nr:universal stress protein [Chloroflexota bacterium]